MREAGAVLNNDLGSASLLSCGWSLLASVVWRGCCGCVCFCCSYDGVSGVGGDCYGGGVCGSCCCGGVCACL